MSCSGEFKYFSSEIFENSAHVNNDLGTKAHLVLGIVFEKTSDTAAGEEVINLS
jgi:hypothetical protein